MWLSAGLNRCLHRLHVDEVISALLRFSPWACYWGVRTTMSRRRNGLEINVDDEGDAMGGIWPFGLIGLCSWGCAQCPIQRPHPNSGSPGRLDTHILSYPYHNAVRSLFQDQRLQDLRRQGTRLRVPGRKLARMLRWRLPPQSGNSPRPAVRDWLIRI